METIAIYWESIIKTYGFLEKTGLSLFRLSFSADRMAKWGANIQSLGAAGDGFLMAAGQVVDGVTLQLNLLFEKQPGKRYQQALEKMVRNDPGLSVQADHAVELVSFHGPHFGDRYGIADAAFGALAGSGLTVLAAGCTGASIYIVVPENIARIAVERLSERFVVPPSAKDTR